MLQAKLTFIVFLYKVIESHKLSLLDFVLKMYIFAKNCQNALSLSKCSNKPMLVTETIFCTQLGTLLELLKMLDGAKNIKSCMTHSCFCEP